MVTTSFGPKTRYMPLQRVRGCRQCVGPGVGQRALDRVEQVRRLGDAQILDLAQRLLIAADQRQRGGFVDGSAIVRGAQERM